MQVWRGLDHLPNPGPCVVAIGVLDGVHRGHALLLARARERARELGQPFIVVTFDPHPASVVRPEATPKMLGTLSDRLDLLEQAGADGVLVLPFTAELSDVAADMAVRAILLDALSVSTIVVGEDFRFGRDREGNAAMLAEAGKLHHFDVDAVELQADEVDRFSSTRIRRLLLEGDVAGAALILGRPFSITGPVMRGEQRGRGLGFPTANLDAPAHLAVPADGVYAGWLDHGGIRYPAAISVGDNPTFAGAAHRIEAYVLDRDDLALYGEQVSVSFVTRLRDMLPFTGVAALIEAMTADVVATRAALGLGSDSDGPPQDARQS
ncbi:MAG: bifunctional riboflavin kinase/FAD synthetase [Sporichthyaceae bacterium]